MPLVSQGLHVVIVTGCLTYQTHIVSVIGEGLMLLVLQTVHTLLVFTDNRIIYTVVL